MPHTIIKIKTYMCPHGLGDLRSDCRFHRAHFNLPADGLCPHCKIALEVATLDDDKITMTVMGEETVESEIEEHIEETYRTRRLAEVVGQLALMDTRGDFPTSIARDRFKVERDIGVEDQITYLKTMPESDPSGPTFKPQGYFLTTPDSITNYRTKRLADISKAITNARNLAGD